MHPRPAGVGADGVALDSQRELAFLELHRVVALVAEVDHVQAVRRRARALTGADALAEVAVIAVLVHAAQVVDDVHRRGGGARALFRLREYAAHNVHEPYHRVASQADRRGEVGADDGSRARLHFVQKRQRALVQRQVRVHVAQMAREYQVERAGAGDEVDGADRLGTAVGQVGCDTPVLADEFHVHAARLAVHRVAVDVVEEAQLAFGNDLLGELAIGGDSALYDLVEGGERGGLPVAVHQLAEAVFGETARRHERAGVAFEHVGESAVVQDDGVSLAVHLAAAHDADWRDEYPLVEDFGRLRRQAARHAAADVPEVAVADGEGDRAPVVEHRRGEAHVAGVLNRAPRAVRVVVPVEVARAHVGDGVFLQNRVHDARAGRRQETVHDAPAQVIDAHEVVHLLFDDRRHGGSLDERLHLPNGRGNRAAYDF